jgi:uncharacterized protein YtpQ (UPF0354 family)
LWLNLYMSDEPTALTTALDFVKQLQSQAQWESNKETAIHTIVYYIHYMSNKCLNFQ